jgi:hypothetical protein
MEEKEMKIDSNDLLKKKQELEKKKKEIDEQIRGIDCVLSLYNIGTKKKAKTDQFVPEVSLQDVCLKIVKSANDVLSAEDVLSRATKKGVTFNAKDPQQSVSRILKKLTDTGKINSFKDGVKIYYQKKAG